MALPVNLQKTISVNNAPMTIRNLVALYKRNKDVQLQEDKIIIAGRRGAPSYSFSITNLDATTLYSLYSSDFGKQTGLLTQLFKYNKTIDANDFAQTLLDNPNNYRFIPEIAVQKDGEPFVTVMEKNNKNMTSLIKNLNAEQAGIVLGQAYQQEIGARAENEKPALKTKDIWNVLPEAVKYTPEVFEKITASEGAPLIADIRFYNKFVNRDKMLTAIMKHPEKLTCFMQAFGERCFFSDYSFVHALINNLKVQAEKTSPKNFDTVLKQFELLTNASKKYLTEVKEMNGFTPVPTEVKAENFEKFLKQPTKKDRIFSKYQLTKNEKEFVTESLLKLDLNQMVQLKDAKNSDKFMKQWLDALTTTKKFHNQKVHVNLDKMMLDKAFMQELFTKTIPASGMYRFFYGSKDKHSDRVTFTVDQIKGGLNHFSGALFRNYEKCLESTKPLNNVSSEKTMKDLSKHESIDLQFSANNFLKPRQKEHLLKDIEKGKYEGEKGAEKLQKKMDKFGTKMTSDKDFIQSVLETIEDHTKDNAFLSKKSFHTAIEENTKANEPTYQAVVKAYDAQLTEYDKLNIKMSEAQQALSEQKQLNDQILLTPEQIAEQAKQEQDQGPEKTM